MGQVLSTDTKRQKRQRQPRRLAALLQRELEVRQWSVSRLAGMINMKQPPMRRIVKDPETIPTVDTLVALAGALDMPLITLVEACATPADDARALAESEAEHGR